MENLGIGAGLAALAFWGFVATAVVAGVWDNIRKREAQHETMRRVVESGQPLDRETMEMLSWASSNEVRHDQAFKITALWCYHYHRLSQYLRLSWAPRRLRRRSRCLVWRHYLPLWAKVFLLHRKQSWIGNLMRRFFGDRALADDLAQQVFVQVWLKVHTLKEAHAFGG